MTGYDVGQRALVVNVPDAVVLRREAGGVGELRETLAGWRPFDLAEGRLRELAEAVGGELTEAPPTAKWLVSGVILATFDGGGWRAEEFLPLGEPPAAEFAFPGPLRDQLVAAILSGEKTTTTGLLADYEYAGDPLPVPGRWGAVVDSGERPVALIETVEVRVVPVKEIDREFAIAEGEGYTTVAEWRATHERFWHSPEMIAALGGQDPVIDDDTLVVAERFRLLR
ncbi:ASCH domain-containing protein [Nonomuraea sp. NPDC050536]|uniref:ASCH domain-containing protein n=1 Tax=Nonomuraea sp. NPDC050536 TaxID=3364366 RepID=UPI0037CC7C6D